MNAPLFDAHCHLQDGRLAAELDMELERARAHGVSGWLCCGCEERDWDAVASLAGHQAGVVPAFGLHPWYVGSQSAGWLDTLRERLLGCPAAAVGEIGLDHAVDPRRDAEQETIFIAQLGLARQLERPASIHCRRAWGALMGHAEELAAVSRGFMVHSFSGAPELVAPLAAAGGYFSFSGSLTWGRNRRAHEAACAVPAGRILIETDAPDIPPCPEEALPVGEGAGAPAWNAPANLLAVARKLSALRGWSLEETARTTWDNACRLYGFGPTAPRRGAA